MRVSWRPRTLPNGVYCSSACGHKCKRADFDRATKAAQKLATSLGKGWKPLVWENLGWHWAVVKGYMRISTYKNTYYAYFNIPGHQTCGDAPNPVTAITQAVNKARIQIEELQRALAPWASI